MFFKKLHRLEYGVMAFVSVTLLALIFLHINKASQVHTCSVWYLIYSKPHYTLQEVAVSCILHLCLSKDNICIQTILILLNANISFYNNS